MEREGYYRYWGKSSPGDTHDCHLLVYHCLDVAAVGRVYLQKNRQILNEFQRIAGLDELKLLDFLTFLLALHDVGKFSSSFQHKLPDLVNYLEGPSAAVHNNHKHGEAGYNILLHITSDVLLSSFTENGFDVQDLNDLLLPLLCATSGHHGTPVELLNNFNPTTYFGITGTEDSKHFIEDLLEAILPGGLPFSETDYDELYSKTNKLTWLFNGVSVLADWIGSSSTWFIPKSSPIELETYWHQHALPQADIAIKESQMVRPEGALEAPLETLFPYIKEPTPLQSAAIDDLTDSGILRRLYVVEEVTGGGKTEAALLICSRLVSAGQADGVYIALPTMATANAMHNRVKGVYKKFFSPESEPSFVLAHSAGHMMKFIDKSMGQAAEQVDDSGNTEGWVYDNRKKALLADVGVGTIDQALLAVLAVKHQNLRVLGLTRKVLVVDEVHACDSYMHKLLLGLLEFHASHGGSAILLSATLPHTQRRELVRAFAKGAGYKPPDIMKTDYPLLTSFGPSGITEKHVPSRSTQSRTVHVNMLKTREDAIKSIVETAENGLCSCFIRNTVDDAIEAYNELKCLLDDEHVMVFHARFTLGDRLSIEEKVLDIYGPSSTPEQRAGRVLVATQVVEQSLDIDFDYMVSDIAPVDLIIQRAGRLQRHQRAERKGDPVLGVFCPDPVQDPQDNWLSEEYGAGSCVYKDHGRLWLTADWLRKKRKFRVPEDMRDMVETVYGEESCDNVPTGLIHTTYEATGVARANRGEADYKTLKRETGYCGHIGAWRDDDHPMTRLGEETRDAYLFKKEGGTVRTLNSADGVHTFAISRVSLNAKKVSNENPAWLPSETKEAKDMMPEKLHKFGVVLVLEETENGWGGSALDINDNPVIIHYSRLTGLATEKGETP